jgi:hypothetical protein
MENYLSELYERDLLKLKTEIESFKDEADIWKTIEGINNPAGVLTKHLLGSVNNFIGAIIGKTGYIRNREREFYQEIEPREKLISKIEATIRVVKNSLQTVDQVKLDEIYPIEFLGQKSTVFYLTSFFGHFNYHLGQINYLRRILEPGKN